jgi:hypothetical protein
MSFFINRSALSLIAFASLLGGCAEQTSGDESGAVGGQQQAAPSADVNAKSEHSKQSSSAEELTSTAQSALTGWTLGITGSASELWPTQPVTITASANRDVTNSGYSLTFWSAGSTRNGKSCNTGTTCSFTVASSTPDTAEYVVGLVNKAGQRVATGPHFSVRWKSSGLQLSASPTTLAVGASTTVTASTSVNLGSTPLYAEIFDMTTNTRIALCGSGTSCSASVSQSEASTHAFSAHLSNSPTETMPETASEGTLPNYVTWSDNGYTLKLEGGPSGTGFVSLQATANVNLTATPYYVQIFDQTTGAWIFGNGYDSSWNAPLDLGPGACHRYIAFISDDGRTLPLANVQASSSPITVCVPQIN